LSDLYSGGNTVQKLQVSIDILSTFTVCGIQVFGAISFYAQQVQAADALTPQDHFLLVITPASTGVQTIYRPGFRPKPTPAKAGAGMTIVVLAKVTSCCGAIELTRQFPAFDPKRTIRSN